MNLLFLSKKYWYLLFVLSYELAHKNIFAWMKIYESTPHIQFYFTNSLKYNPLEEKNL